MFIKEVKKSHPKIPTKARLKNIALYYLERFESSKKNLFDVLKRRVDKYVFFDKEYNPHQAYQWIDEIIEELSNQNFVNDNRFAHLKIDNYLAQGKSRRYIEQNLIQKGIDKAIIAQYFEKSEYSEMATALNFAQKKKIGCFRCSDEDRISNRQKDLASLVRAGFDYDIAQEIVNREIDSN